MYFDYLIIFNKQYEIYLLKRITYIFNGIKDLSQLFTYFVY